MRGVDGTDLLSRLSAPPACLSVVRPQLAIADGLYMENKPWALAEGLRHSGVAAAPPRNFRNGFEGTLALSAAQLLLALDRLEPGGRLLARASCRGTTRTAQLHCRLMAAFTTVKAYKPRSSHAVRSSVYVCALGFRGRGHPAVQQVVRELTAELAAARAGAPVPPPETAGILANTDALVALLSEPWRVQAAAVRRLHAKAIRLCGNGGGGGGGGSSSSRTALAAPAASSGDAVLLEVTNTTRSPTPVQHGVPWQKRVLWRPGPQASTSGAPEGGAGTTEAPGQQ